MGQGTQAWALDTGLNVPMGQSLHTPAAVRNVPGAHSGLEDDVQFTEPATDVVPAGHGVHDADAPRALKVPAGHGKQDVEPDTSL